MCSSDSLSRCHCVPVGSVAAAGGDVEAGLAVGAVRARVLGRGGDVPELFVADRRAHWPRPTRSELENGAHRPRGGARVRFP